MCTRTRRSCSRSNLSTETMSFFIHFGGWSRAPAKRRGRGDHARFLARDRDARGLRDCPLRVSRRRTRSGSPSWRRARSRSSSSRSRSRSSSSAGASTTPRSASIAHTAGASVRVLTTSSVFAGVSPELEEAAMTLGCSRATAFVKVVLPLALPGLAASAIFVVHHLLERGLRGLAPHAPPSHAAGQVLPCSRALRCTSASPAASS